MASRRNGPAEKADRSWPCASGARARARFDRYARRARRELADDSRFAETALGEDIEDPAGRPGGASHEQSTRCLRVGEQCAFRFVDV
jgi:hypothetical protein